MLAETGRRPIPPHVPDHLVRDLPFANSLHRRDDPHDAIAALHDGPEIFFAPNCLWHGAWVVRSLVRLKEVFLDTTAFTTRDFRHVGTLPSEPIDIMLPLEVDPPLHGPFRKALNAPFAPARLARLDGPLQRAADTLIDAFIDQGECELMRSFADAFPTIGYMALLGLPIEEAADVVAMARNIVDGDTLAEKRAAIGSVRDYLTKNIQARRASPGDDLLSHLTQVEVEGRPLEDPQILAYCRNLYEGGINTVSSVTGWAVRHLAMRPDHQRLLRAEPERIPDAVEEFLRAFASITVPRTCVVRRQIGDAVIEPGDIVLLSMVLAGRDPTAYERPADVVLDRRPQHKTFAHGPHACVGAGYARLELRLALGALLRRLPEFSLGADGALMHCAAPGVLGFDRLPLTWR